MGCTPSKEKVCRNCQAPYSSVRRSTSSMSQSPVWRRRRSYSMHVHHPRQEAGDSFHLVTLTSSTLGYLNLDNILEDEETIDGPLNKTQAAVEDKHSIRNKETLKKEEFVSAAKSWSKMINEKIPKVMPKTPITTPPGEPETINAWEMMEGLEEIDPLDQVHHFRSFSFNVPQKSSLSSIYNEQTPKAKEIGNAPLWSDLAESDSTSSSNDTSIVSEFDHDVIATFRRALEDLPPANPFRLKTFDGEKTVTNEKDASVPLPTRGRDKLVLYFTSLRGVRKTYEDCCYVRVMLKGLGVKIDERDVSMHSGFKEELKELLPEGFGGGGLPKIFIGGKYIGGEEEIRRLNEEGKLEKMVESCELVENGGGNVRVCEACGDVRFVPCETCSGSCKIYYEECDYDGEEEFDGSESDYGFHRCPNCNENGLIRCPICCD